MAAYDTLAVLTTQAKSRMARGLQNGKSFAIEYFALGDEGTIPSDPTIAIPPDPNLTDYIYGNVLNPAGPPTGGGLPLPSGATIAGITYPTETCPVVSCLLPPSAYVGPFSAIYLLARIVYSPIPSDPEVGRYFIAAVATRPRSVLSPVDPFSSDVGIVLGS